MIITERPDGMKNDFKFCVEQKIFSVIVTYLSIVDTSLFVAVFEREVQSGRAAPLPPAPVHVAHILRPLRCVALWLL